MANTFKGVVHLPSKEAFEALMNNGSLETDAGTIVYSPETTIYTTPDSTDAQFVEIFSRLNDLETSVGAVNTSLENILGV